jgi:type I restriction enzyme S subunit
MNAERLLALYKRVAEAPDAIARLRRFILDLAVRGKLVPQDPQDEPASELLKRIAKEKARLVKAGEIRIPKTVPLLFEAPYPIPPNWQWSKLSEIGILNPRNTAADLLETSFVPMPMIAADYGLAHQHEVRPWGEIKKGYTHFAEGDVGLAKITPCFENGKSAVFRNLTGGIGAGTTELHIVRPLFADQDYILLFLKSPHFIQTGIPKMTGTAGQKRVPTEYFAYSPFPLPPLAEQHRIVAKVDELMALCDQLEAARQEREARRDRLAAASLARLNAPDPETFQSDARFTLEALPALTTRPNQIKQLRQTILNLAVRGKLVPQDPNDEPAATLSERLAKKFAKEPIGIGRGRRSEIVAGLIEKAPYLVPSGWLWVRMGDLGETNIGLTYSPVEISSAGIPVLRSNNIQAGKIHLSDLVRVTSKPKPSAMVSEGDLLICARNGSRSLVGKAAIIERLSEPMAFGAFMAIFRSPVNRYLHLFLSSPVFRQVIDEVNTNTINQITQANLRSTLISLPPLAEQHRIVAKVDELMALCDRLEASLTTSDQTRTRLLEATLAEALAPASISEMESAE